jgi:aminoglycoside 3-N-acetyltransferase
MTSNDMSTNPPKQETVLHRRPEGERPVTASRLRRKLRALGLRSRHSLIVHTSLARIDWVPGGAQTVVDVLLHLVGPKGTVVIPSHPGQLTDTG